MSILGTKEGLGSANVTVHVHGTMTDERDRNHQRGMTCRADYARHDAIPNLPHLCSPLSDSHAIMESSIFISICPSHTYHQTCTSINNHPPT